MTTGSNFWDINIWVFVLVLGAIFVSMLLSNLLIKVIKPLRKALIPAPVLGGFIMLGGYYIFKAIVGFNEDSILPVQNILEILTYHCLGIGFVATALKTTKKIEEKKNSSQKGFFDSALVVVGNYVIQAIIGLAVSVALFFILGSWPASGLLVPMGFGQGPGQAFNWGSNYEANTIESAFGAFQYGKSFGLSVAAMGFIAASIGGVIFLNIERKKGNIKMANAMEEEETKTVEHFTDSNEIPDSESIDKASVEIGLILIAYTISFFLIYGISQLCDMSGVGFLINTVKPLFWGFNFIFGTLVATIMKICLNGLRRKGIVKRQYTNNYMLDRASGVAFDIMVVAAIAAIDLSAFTHAEFIVPLIVMCVLASVGTYFYTKFVCYRLFPDYKEEAFISMFGMLTGTASTGVILLREIDPKFKTPAANNLVFQSLYAILLGGPILLAMGSLPKTWTSLIVWGSIIVAYFGLVVVITFRNKIFKKRDKALQTVEEDANKTVQ